MSNIKVEKKSANLKSQFWREQKKVVVSKKTGSSPKKPTWFACEALLFLLQQTNQGEVAAPSLKEGMM
jgi:hypothetical protein